MSSPFPGRQKRLLSRSEAGRRIRVFGQFSKFLDFSQAILS
jgi:hypothetical protein